MQHITMELFVERQLASHSTKHPLINDPKMEPQSQAFIQLCSEKKWTAKKKKKLVEGLGTRLPKIQLQDG